VTEKRRSFGGAARPSYGLDPAWVFGLWPVEDKLIQ